MELLIWADRLDKIHEKLGDIQWKEFEDQEMSINMCTRHCDLHGENVRVSADLSVMLIDYGAVGNLPSAIDPITVELSPFFHPHGHRDMLRWQTDMGEIDWFNRDDFRALTLVPYYIDVARGWAHAEAFGEREVLACCYIYVLRQLQFSTTDQPLARAIIKGVVRRGLNA